LAARGVDPVVTWGGGKELEHRRSPRVQWEQVHPRARNKFWGLNSGGSCKCTPSARAHFLPESEKRHLRGVLGGILHSEYDDD